MTKVIDQENVDTSHSIFICDFSPPRGQQKKWLTDAIDLDADCICVSYSPGRSVRMDSATAAHLIEHQSGRDVMFNLGTQDMNKVAIQSYLLGANAMGLQNVVVLEGDNRKVLGGTNASMSACFTPTELIASIKDLNQGVDYRREEIGIKTDFCIGAVVDLGKGVEEELLLVRRKVESGADFILTQPVFQLDQVERFVDGFYGRYGYKVPVFFGVHILVKDGVLFSKVPKELGLALRNGRSGSEIAIEFLGQLRHLGISNIYLVAPIFPGGARDYHTAQRVMNAIKWPNPIANRGGKE